jgi:LEA14-like dessication related protein
MRGEKHLILSLALVAALFAGCETSRKVVPTAQMMGLKFENVKRGSVTLLFDVEINNPYAVGLPLTNLNYVLTSGANTFLQGSAELQTTVPASSKEIVSLPAKVNYKNMLKALKDASPGSKIPYKAELELSVNTPTSGLIKLPTFGGEGELVLPKAPTPKVKVKKEPPNVSVGGRTPDVIFVPTPQEVVDKMLELVDVKKDELLYDLGCGDGRIVVTAAKRYGCKAVGFDIDPQRIKESLENVEKNNVGDLVKIEQKDIFTLDLSEANVITLYLLPRLNVKLIPQLEKLKPGSRIVSHDFDMEGVTPDKVITLTSSDGNAEHTVYFWTTPLKKEKKEPAPVQN